MTKMNADQLDEFTLELGGVSEIGLTVALIIMMFAVALSIRPDHFKFFKTQPYSYLAGVTAQLLALPLLALGLSFILKPHASLALGMIVVACCPGGNVSNLLSLFARGNTALSVSLTATSSLFAALLTPISILFWCQLYPPTRELLTQIDFDVIDFLLKALLILALPLASGMIIAIKRPQLAQKIMKPLALCGAGLLILITVVAIVQYWSLFWAIGASVLAMIILFNALAFLLGYIFAKLARANSAATRSITIEVGIQNVGLAIVILVTQLDGLGGAAAVAGLWGTWHIIAGALLVSLFRWQDRRQHV